MLEVHAVTQQGKDSGSLGIWSDEHISPLQKVVQAIHDQGSKDSLQLWHVGRKGSLPQETAISASGLPHREQYHPLDRTLNRTISTIIGVPERIASPSLRRIVSDAGVRLYNVLSCIIPLMYRLA